VDDAAANEASMRAFIQWFAANLDAIVEGCRKRMPNVRGYTASDAVKSAFAEVLKSPPPDPIESPAAFLRLVAWRKYCLRLRKQARADEARPFLARDSGADDPAPEQLSAEDAVSHMRNNLSIVEQIVFQGKLDGLTNAEVANVLHDRKLVEGCGAEQVRAIWRALVRRWREAEAEE
jgi:DNA-directed RNA polymerase specialized sigma24 family protein